MNMRQNVMDIYNSIINNEDILRLLIYNPTDYSDNPLDPNKPNILDMEINERIKLIDKHILKTPKASDLTVDKELSRLCIYPARRRPTGNYEVADQEIVFDIYVHHRVDHIDLRSPWLCDYINNFINGSRITGIGAIRFEGGSMIVAPDGYVGQRFVYTFGSVKR